MGVGLPEELPDCEQEGKGGSLAAWKVMESDGKRKQIASPETNRVQSAWQKQLDQEALSRQKVS